MSEEVFLLLHHTLTAIPPTHVLIFLASALLMPFSCHSLSFLMDVCISYDMKKESKKKELERNATITLNSSSASFELSTSLKKVSLLMKCFGAGIIYFLKENMRKLFSLHTVCKCCHHFSAHKQMLPTERQKYTQGQIFPCKEGEDVEKLA